MVNAAILDCIFIDVTRGLYYFICIWVTLYIEHTIENKGTHMESIKDSELGRERGMGKNIKSMQVLWFVNTATISYPRRPNYYFDIHEEVDHLYYYHLRYDHKMGINTFQPDYFVLKDSNHP